LKKDLNTAERKLAERKERIVNLERLVAQSENQLRMKEQEFQRVSKELHEQLTAAHTREQAFSSGGAIGFGRIAKPLRGEFVCNHRQNMRLKSDLCRRGWRECTRSCRGRRAIWCEQCKSFERIGKRRKWKW
jgi:hypothetical protein